MGLRDIEQPSTIKTVWHFWNTMEVQSTIKLSSAAGQNRLSSCRYGDDTSNWHGRISQEQTIPMQTIWIREQWMERGEGVQWGIAWHVAYRSWWAETMAALVSLPLTAVGVSLSAALQGFPKLNSVHFTDRKPVCRLALDQHFKFWSWFAIRL